MKILLIDDNPVINKLVTLSAQKTSDELDVVTSLEELESQDYDLIVIDDTLYSAELYTELSEKVNFSKSLYICSRNAEEVEGFTRTLKKPFLPTDLVELFAMLGKEDVEVNLDDDISTPDEVEEEPQVLEDINDIDLGDDEISLDELDDLSDIEDLEEDISLDDLDLDDDTLGESILDDKEAQKVKDLLDEADGEELEFGDLNELELDTEDEVETELEVDEKELDLEAQIENAVEELSDEELESEVDLEIVTNDIDSLDGLTSRDIKIAVGEEVEEELEIVEEIEEDEMLEDETPVQESEESQDEAKIVDVEADVTESVEGVEALKNLLTALSDTNVSGSMKGMKISINITFGAN